MEVNNQDQLQEDQPEATLEEHPFHGQGVAKFKCNACGGVYERDLGWKTWTPSYCEKTGKNARLYRISAPAAKAQEEDCP